jgi:Cu/Ag efflux protein CusF
VPLHEKVGMRGELVVGGGGNPEAGAEVASKRLWEGIGTVVSADLRRSRLVVDHGEITGFMAAMTMSYAVTRPELLTNLRPGQPIRFTIDAELRAIVDITPVPK